MRLVLVLACVALAAACQHSDVSREVGARCDKSTECDERCLTDSAEYPGGFCTVTCNDKTECPTATTCGDVDGGVCLYDCKTDGECAFLGTGWQCKAVDLRGGGIKVMVCRGG